MHACMCASMHPFMDAYMAVCIRSRLYVQLHTAHTMMNLVTLILYHSHTHTHAHATLTSPSTLHASTHTNTNTHMRAHKLAHTHKHTHVYAPRPEEPTHLAFEFLKHI